MSNRFCSLFLVFCLVFATLVQSGYCGLIGSLNTEVINIELPNFFDEPMDEGFPSEGHHEEEALQIVDILETEPHLNNTAHIVFHGDFNSRDNHFEFLDRSNTWHSDNTSPPPEA